MKWTEKKLKAKGHDGLCGHDNCGCGLDDFAPCEDGPFIDCTPGKFVLCKYCADGGMCELGNARDGGKHDGCYFQVEEEK